MIRKTPPIDDVPSELSDEEAAELLAQLHRTIDALEQHYASRLYRLEHARRAPHQSCAFDEPESDPPF